MLLAACGSTKVNTAQSRFYQAFVTRFNTYHNGHEAYKEGLASQERSHKDNYMVHPEINIVTIPIYGTGTPKTPCITGQPAPSNESGRPRLIKAR